jgi:hypothetical protein
LPDESQTALNANGEQGGETPPEPMMTRSQVEALLKEQIENNGAYKGMQTALNRNVQKFQQEVAARDQRIAELESRLNGAAEATDFIGAKFIAALPPEDRAAVEAELSARELKALRKEIADMKNPRPPAGVTQPVTNQDDWDEQLRIVLAEAKESLEDAVKAHGLDPKDKGLDYGKDEDGFAKRLKALNASISKVKAAKDEADVDSVRQKTPVPPTRTGGGAATGNLAGTEGAGRGISAQAVVILAATE